ncbi:MAG: hypothetical protein AAGH78_15085 [Cyanobacteria bacterium P01_H01_bin.58]
MNKSVICYFSNILLETIRYEVVDLLPRAELIEVSGVGHLIPLEAADLVAAAIRRSVG